MPSAINTSPCRSPLPRGGTSAVSARMPPSPALSARITMAMYLIEMTITQRVDDERQHAEHVFRRRRHRVAAEETLPDRVERAGADVAVHHADGGQREREQRAGGGDGLWRRRDRRGVGDVCHVRA